ncbi:hypothetical protein B4U37_19960 [Sutcliffiella horikoshii]|uniref:Uncharacterized protein n=1 Tax=Sutcliffiella horikoshii TaxID=79883 RepID=A0ABN4ZQ24_9BACI|nr:hypothetical protein B4U37_19960 [Sutcliffiella horikoshii]
MNNVSKKAQWILAIIIFLVHILAFEIEIYYLKIDNLILKALYLFTSAFVPYLIARLFILPKLKH